MGIETEEQQEKAADSTRSGSRTLLASLLLSAPGPAILLFGLFLGRSSTQIADFVRRTAEFLAIVAAYVVYTRVHNKNRAVEPEEADRLERGCSLFTGSVMCISGSCMLFVTLFFQSVRSGSVLLSLIIAAAGAVSNGILWRRYVRHAKGSDSPILSAQAGLYRAKTAVDCCVTAALAAVMLAPEAAFTPWVDRIGSIVVSAYLILSGIKTIRETLGKTGADRSDETA